MATIHVGCVRCSTRSLAVASACFGAALVALAVDLREEKALSATSIQVRIDQDRDGFSDLQEQILRTQPMLADTDGDTYSDFEEHARGSDPRDVLSSPQGDSFGVGMCATQDGDVLHVVSAVFIDEPMIGAVDFQIGLVLMGRVYRFAPRDFGLYRGFQRMAHDANDRLVGVEVVVPVDLVRRRGRLNMFGIVRDETGVHESVVSLLPLVDFSGTITSVEQVSLGLNNVNGGQGVVYRPLASDGDIPVTWNGGEMCFQRTAAVGVSGVTIVHEIEAAGCVPMDTYCSPGDCSASVGQSLVLPDPAALAGG